MVFWTLPVKFANPERPGVWPVHWQIPVYLENGNYTLPGCPFLRKKGRKHRSNVNIGNNHGKTQQLQKSS
jgi:hypothetical protein